MGNAGRGQGDAGAEASRGPPRYAQPAEERRIEGGSQYLKLSAFYAAVSLKIANFPYTHTWQS